LLNIQYTNPNTNKIIKSTVNDIEESMALQKELQDEYSKFDFEIVVLDYPFTNELKETLPVRQLNWIVNNPYHPNALNDHILMLEAGTIEEDEFWSLIETFDWPSDLSYDRINSELLAGLYGPRGKTLAIDNKFRSVKKALYEAIEDQLDYKGLEYEKVIGLGDDSFDDLLSHIIGSGRKAYNKAFKNPVFAGKQPRNESFAYSFNSL